MRILLSNGKENIIVTLVGLLAVGGKKSSGQRLSLAKDDDYLVLSPTASNTVSLVPLKGKDRTPRQVSSLESIQVDDLWVMPLPKESSLGPHSVNTSLPQLQLAMQDIAHASDDHGLASIVLRHTLKLTGFDRGLVVTKNNSEKFEVITHQGTDPSAPWLSESLLQETLSTNSSVVVANVVGSRFEKNLSLIGTGFLSVATWPLVWRGETVGAIIAGSPFPHSHQLIEHSAVELLAPYAAQHAANWLKESKLKRRLAQLEQAKYEDTPFITQAKSMLDMLSLARRIAPSDLSILIQGETGVGKEVLAKWLHEKSLSNKGAFIPVNCGAIPENLIESTLFGHKKGSFTGAVSDQTGKFILAHGGTLFLDEVADLPLNVQGKLLRALQEKVIEPVGALRGISVNVRVLCATHKDLRSMVAKGTFREDLYYRLAEVTLEIPPLRARGEDSVLIAENYLHDNKIDKKLSPTAWQWLQTQRWPGNVRELLSTLRRAHLLAQGKQIEVKDLMPQSAFQTSSSWLGADTLDEACRKFQQDKVRTALQMTGGNRKEAAELLGVTARTLFRYLEDLRQDEASL